jgi:hypothetical protein
MTPRNDSICEPLMDSRRLPSQKFFSWTSSDSYWVMGEAKGSNPETLMAGCEKRRKMTTKERDSSMQVLTVLATAMVTFGSLWTD